MYGQFHCRPIQPTALFNVWPAVFVPILQTPTSCRVQVLIAKPPVRLTHAVRTRHVVAGNVPYGALPFRYAGVKAQLEYQTLLVESYRQWAAVSMMLLLMLVAEQ